MNQREKGFIVSALRLAMAENLGSKLTPELANGLLHRLLTEVEPLCLDHASEPIPVERMPIQEYGGFLFQAERLADCLEEIKPLHQAHWMETEQYRHGLELNMDYAFMLKAEQAGTYLLFTVRELETNKLVGNLGSYIQRSTHTQTLIASEDTLYFLPEARKGRTALKFLAYAEDATREILGVKEFRASTKTVNQVGRLLEHAGYIHTANQYCKILED